MAANIESGLLNRLYRMMAAFRTSRTRPTKPLALEDMAQKYGRGNVKLQMGLVMSDEEYAQQKKRVLAYDFI